MSRKEIGAAPGQIVYTGEGGKDIRCELHRFRNEKLETVQLQNGLPELDFSPSETSWLIVEGIHNVDLIKSLGTTFKIHPLVLEDIVHPVQRMKVEEYEDTLFLVLKFLRLDSDFELNESQWSLLVRDHWLIFFSETHPEELDPIFKRLAKGTSVMRSTGADYLCYALVDLVGDHYLNITDRLSEELENLEQQVLETNQPNFEDLIHIQRQGHILKKHARQFRDLLSSLLKEDTPVIQASSRVFLRDVYDHMLYCCDQADSLQARVNAALSYYHSYMGLKLNEIMKFLTLIGTIFIPLTFLAGIYGMNFKWMPELEWPWGYPALLGLMALVMGVILLYFKKRKWL